MSAALQAGSQKPQHRPAIVLEVPATFGGAASRLSANFGAFDDGRPIALQVRMLHLDRYVRKGDSRALDLATGCDVSLESSPPDSFRLELFRRHRGRTLIDYTESAGSRLAVWERWVPPHVTPDVDTVRLDFVEMLDQARQGAPRGFDLMMASRADSGFVWRVLAREARLRGWVAISAEMLARAGATRTAPMRWLEDRSMVVFVETGALSSECVVALLRLARRDTRPHVLVRSYDQGRACRKGPAAEAQPLVHEAMPPLIDVASTDRPDLAAEARARWALLLQELTSGAARDDRLLELARVLACRDQGFEARALVARLPVDIPDIAAAAARVVRGLDERAAARVDERLTGEHESDAGGWEMVDDFVAVLQLCQDVEDEQVTLARVGAFVRDRLQASSIAFVVREGRLTRILARIGSDVATPALADRAIETGVAVVPSRADGPVESACPIRHAADVIGALWCRWGAGIPVAGRHASSLLSVAAAATAPSVRLALVRRQPANDVNAIPELVGESAAIREIREQIVRAAASPFPVVIEGESGSGKELVARAIHRRSVRRDQRFSPINCAALVDELVEAELFGHARGAFTGATTDRKGVFEEANGGTLFLDEIAELGGRVQAKLLRALQEGEVRRLGESIVRKVDVRVVAATNRPLARQVADGAFRADLWYRLDVIRLTLPPLRERVEDIPLLVDHLWRALVARTGHPVRLSASALMALAGYDWPGNVRELQNVLASMMVATPRHGLVGPAALPSHVARAAATEARSTLAEARRQFEQRYVRAALARAGGRTSTAARDLGLSRQGLAKLLGRLGIAEPRVQPAPNANVQ
jgi:DNA-binding NtrC family response regulator